MENTAPTAPLAATTPRLPPLWLGIGCLVIVIEAVEYFAPTGYIFSYLYAVPILLAAQFLEAAMARWLVALGVSSTLLGLVVPVPELNIQTVINRLIVCSALATVAHLGLRYRRARDEAEAGQEELASQRSLLDAYENFTAALTHDLKTPLVGVEQTLGFLEAGRFGALSHEQQQVVQLCGRSLTRLHELTDTLLAIYRNEHQPLALAMEPVDVAVLAREVVERWVRPAAERRVVLVCDAPLASEVTADALQLERALNNLVSNAVRYTRLGSTVQVRVRREAKLCLIEVSDAGPGIPPEDLKRLFERFYQSPLTRQSLGTGLGLYLSRQLVEAHGGRIWVTNRPEGGCTFGICLPLRR